MILVLVLLTSFLGEEISKELTGALQRIDVNSIQEQTKFLTSPECAGRDTCQPGGMLAAEYIGDQLKTLGFAPVLPDGEFLRWFELPVVDAGADDFVAVMRGKNLEDMEVFASGSDFIPVRGSPPGEVEGEVVFAGYGIADADERYDDYRGVSVKDRIALVLSHEPRQNKRGRAFQGLEFTRSARIDAKAVAAAERGAKAVLVVSNPLHHADLSVLKTEHPRFHGARNPMEGRPPDVNIPLLHISGEVAEALIGVKQLREWQTSIDKKLRGAPRLLEGVRVRLQCSIQWKDANVANVIGIRKGDNPTLQEEWVVLGAHYDHIGVDPYGRRYPGADDNASGVSCLLQVAAVLSDPDLPLERSVLLAAFAAEERGLLGAAAFCEEPPVPLENVVTMINVDMVGRGKKTEIDAAGSSYSADLTRSIKRATSLSRTRLRVGDEGMNLFRRSDQFEFWKRGVPVLFFTEPSSEHHGDYHRISDTADKINHEKIVRVSRVVAALTALLANAEDRPEAKVGSAGGSDNRGR